MIKVIVARQGPMMNFQVDPTTVERCFGPPLIGVEMTFEDLKDTRRLNLIAYMLTGHETTEVQFIEAGAGDILYSCLPQKDLQEEVR